MPWREFGGATGPRGGGERAFPRPLGRRRGASSSASLAEGALGSSGVPLLSATAAPPAPLGGDGDQRRRSSDSEELESTPAAGEALGGRSRFRIWHPSLILLQYVDDILLAASTEQDCRTGWPTLADSRVKRNYISYPYTLDPPPAAGIPGDSRVLPILDPRICRNSSPPLFTD
uniref:agouti-related protein isoform X3 n=1 Tax=Myodes glareolus TaxID=447135 RepID=UPI00202124A5|nr:agouti-related protein isoform X3 [Myodes glareolus]